MIYLPVVCSFSISLMPSWVKCMLPIGPRLRNPYPINQFTIFNWLCNFIRLKYWIGFDYFLYSFIHSGFNKTTNFDVGIFLYFEEPNWFSLTLDGDISTKLSICLLFNDYKTVQWIRGLFDILPISIYSCFC